MTRLKRNDVVSNVDGGWQSYGRVNRVFRDGTIEVIDCGKSVTVDFPEAWQKEYYTGYSHLVHKFKKDDYGTIELDENHNYVILASYTRFHPMPTLRKLKQMASKYNKQVWKKHRD